MTSSSEPLSAHEIPDDGLKSTAAVPLAAVDEPMDAFVVEDYPPLTAIVDYPYGSTAYPYTVAIPGHAERQSGLAAILNYQPPSPAQYMVPRRFGMSAILGIMTALAMLFGSFRLLNAEPVVYLFFGMQTLVICFAQMLNSKSPRLASSVAGAILVPLFVLPLFFYRDLSFDPGRIVLAVFSLTVLVPFGAFLGYLTGTCAAGIFLVMDYLEPILQGQGSARSVSG